MVPRWRSLLLGLAAVALTACSDSAPATVTKLPPTASSGPVASAPALAGAEALVYANRYAAADRAYRSLVAARPGDALAHAAYALFLAVRLDLGAAVAEAEAAVRAGPSNGRAYAALCRAEDWSDHLAPAVAAGRRAVALAPADPLAHLFLSEALADSGDLAAARVEIAAARPLVPETGPVEIRAELRREEGNLAHDAGDTPGELNAYRAAYDIQPTWAQRPAELAGAYLDAGDLGNAHASFAAALALAPDDPNLLSALGHVTLLQPDYATAEAVYGRLEALRPGDPVILTIAAQIAMAAHGDVDGAAALLERALTADPRDEEAAAYLYYLERDARGDEQRGRAEIAASVAAAADDSRPGLAAPRPPDIAASLDRQRSVALDAVNAARAAAGLDPVVLDAHLSESAVRHCYYWLFNNASPSVAKLGIHEERPGLPGFSGVSWVDRAEAAGWRTGFVGEDITHRDHPEKSVADWVDSVFHRFPIMRPDLLAVGYANCSVGSLPMQDMEFGFSAAPRDRHAPVVYPGSGQTGVPVVFIDNELPDPVPAGQPLTTGYPVTVTFDPLSAPRVLSFTVRDASGRTLDGYRLAPSAETENSASFLPAAPLTPGTRYTASIGGLIDGRPWSTTWTFTAAASPPPAV